MLVGDFTLVVMLEHSGEEGPGVGYIAILKRTRKDYLILYGFIGNDEKYWRPIMLYSRIPPRRC